VVCAAIGGFGLLGLTVFLVGHISLTPWTLGALLATGVALAIFSKVRPWQLRVPTEKAPAAIVCAMLVLTAVAGLAEPLSGAGSGV
jgi:hypothetical protein